MNCQRCGLELTPVQGQEKVFYECKRCDRLVHISFITPPNMIEAKDGTSNLAEKANTEKVR